VQPEGVYAIEAEEVEPLETYVIEEQSLAEADTPEPPAQRDDAPGLQFPAAGDAEDGMARVERLLASAQEQFRAGEREAASTTLAAAAGAYEAIGRMESAATIYRSLGRGAQATTEVLQRWLGNCEARGDQAEAAQVACELGDRALNESDEAAAEQWFERALALEPGHETAGRRLARLRGERPAAAPRAAVPAEPATPEPGRVEVAVGRAEAVTFDLGGLLAEFQRGVEAQLSGDAQSHYDLGMTYREMGLLEQAVESFRIAEQDPRLMARALEMVGRCFTDMGRWGEASVEFGRALQGAGIEPVAAAELRYHHGVALAHSGDPLAALREFEQVAAVIPGYEDVDERIASLREQLGKAA
jgi:tetratricopeptide (TPR) repeat protein